MSNHLTERGSGGDRQQMPAWVRGAVFLVTGSILAGGLYLIAVRGDVLLSDLSALMTLICG